MSPNVPGDDPPDVADPDDEDDDVEGGNDAIVVPPPAPRGRRRQLIEARTDELGTWRYFNVHSPRDPVEFIVRGDKIGTDGGSAVVLGTVLQRLGRLIQNLGKVEPFVEQLAFANSVHILLRPANDDIARAEADLSRARQLEPPGEAEDVLDPTVRQLLREAVPRVHVAAMLAAELVEATPDDAPRVAVALGSGVAQSYKSLATSVFKDNIEMSFAAPEREVPVVLTASKAEHVVEALRAITEPEEFTIITYGLLSLADGFHHEFGLRLERRSRAEHAILRGRQIVRGSFGPGTEDAIRDRSLWGKRVRATVRVRTDAVVSTSTVRPATFVLLDAVDAAA